MLKNSFNRRHWPLHARLPEVPMWVVADRGCSSHAFREHVWNLGARPTVPARRDETPVAYPEPVYNNRNRVERLWARLKEWRAIATRYEKTALFPWRALHRSNGGFAQSRQALTGLSAASACHCASVNTAAPPAATIHRSRAW